MSEKTLVVSRLSFRKCVFIFVSSSFWASVEFNWIFCHYFHLGWEQKIRPQASIVLAVVMKETIAHVIMLMLLWRAVVCRPSTPSTSFMRCLMPVQMAALCTSQTRCRTVSRVWFSRPGRVWLSTVIWSSQVSSNLFVRQWSVINDWQRQITGKMSGCWRLTLQDLTLCKQCRHFLCFVCSHNIWSIVPSL